MIQILRLFGNLPMMLELSMNYCSQGCEYCYAKTWKREQIAIDKVINNILYLETKKEGWLSWLIRKREPIALSNRTDVMCTPDWRERLHALKKLGFPLYLETKLTKEYKDLADILNPDTDMIYQTITGLNNKYEEHNHLTPEEKIEAAKFFVEKGFNTVIGINPFMPDKCSTDDIKKIITDIKPRSGIIMHDYHTTSKNIHRHLFPPEYPPETMKAARMEIMDWCEQNKILYDIQDWNHLSAEKCGTGLLHRIDENNFMFNGNHFVFDEFLFAIQQSFRDNPDIDIYEIYFDDFCDFFAKQIDYFKDAVITYNDYAFHIWNKEKKLLTFGGREKFDIVHFLRSMWNAGEMKMIFDYYKDGGKPKIDKNGNMVYFRCRDGFFSDILEQEKNA